MKLLNLFKKEKEDLLIASPYVIHIENKSDKIQKAVIFGDALHGGKENFGSDKDIVISNLQGSTYYHLLKQSACKPFIISKMRFHTDNIENKRSILTYCIFDADGHSMSNKLTLAEHIDVFQYQGNIIDITTTHQIDCNSYFELEIAANSIVTIAMYPSFINSGFNHEYYKKPNQYKLLAPVTVSVDIKSATKMLWYKFLSFFKSKKP